MLPLNLNTPVCFHYLDALDQEFNPNNLLLGHSGQGLSPIISPLPTLNDLTHPLASFAAQRWMRNTAQLETPEPPSVSQSTAFAPLSQIRLSPTCKLIFCIAFCG